MLQFRILVDRDDLQHYRNRYQVGNGLAWLDLERHEWNRLLDASGLHHSVVAPKEWLASLFAPEGVGPLVAKRAR